MSLAHPDDPTPSRRFSVSLQTILVGIAAGLISLGSALVAYLWLEFSLGFVFAAPVCAMLVALPLAGASSDCRTSLAFACVIALGTATPVCLAATGYAGFASASLQLAMLCFAAALLAIEGVRLMARGGVHPAIPGAVVLVLSAAWMSLPVWMSPHFSEPWGEWVIDHLLAYQPLIALNGAFAPLGDWSHQPLAYTWLTSLGQDVPFAFPPNAWRCVAGHLAIGLLALLGNILCDRARGGVRSGLTV